MRSVWSRVGSGSITVVVARRVEPGEQHRRLDLRRGHRQAIADRHRLGRAGDRQRQAAAFARDEACADPAQRLDDAAHRPAAQRGVAGEEGGERMGGEQPHEEPRAGAGIAEIEHVVGLAQPADADAVDAPATVARRAPALAPSARMAAAVASTSSPSSRPSISVSPTASAPSISARCEIDLSPGTRATARQGAGRSGPKRLQGDLRSKAGGDRRAAL